MRMLQFSGMPSSSWPLARSRRMAQGAVLHALAWAMHTVAVGSAGSRPACTVSSPWEVGCGGHTVVWQTNSPQLAAVTGGAGRLQPANESTRSGLL